MITAIRSGFSSLKFISEPYEKGLLSDVNYSSPLSFGAMNHNIDAQLHVEEMERTVTPQAMVQQ